MGKTKTKIVEETETKEVKKSAGLKEQKVEKKKILLNSARFYIRANQNNTIISLTDHSGNVLLQSSAGAAGFKNTKKGTPYAGAKSMELMLSKLNKFDIKEVKIFVRGVGPGREPSIRALFNANLNIIAIEDRTPIPFGGPTPKARRKV